MSLRLAILDIGTADLRWWAPQVLDRYPGGFFEMHERIFKRAGRELGIDVRLQRFERGEYPTLSDGIVISGCANSANDDEPWLVGLRDRIRDWKGKTRISGFSFAPQVCAVALGGKVDRNPRGSELSVVSVELTEAFRSKFQQARKSYLIHVHHNDAVLELPPGAQSLGRTPVTEHQGWFLNDDILVFSGHPEYSMDPWILEQLMAVEARENLIATQHVNYGRADNYKSTDWLWQTKLQLAFFRGDFSPPQVSRAG